MTAAGAGLYLVDASIYIFRGWYVWPDTLADDDGNPINAVIGFADFLLRLIETRKPRQIACAFDTSLGKSVRQSVYPAYKANRPEAPTELKYQFELCRALVAASGLAGFASERYEADDILGAFAGYAQQTDTPFTVVTADKDLTQLIGKRDFWWNFAKDDWLDYRGIERRFGVRPEQIAELLALSGDAVDNIPGVPGIGMATAARLLKKWGTIDTLYDHIDHVGDMQFRGAKRIQSLLQEHRATVEIARRLTPVLTDPNVPSSLNCLRPCSPDAARFAALSHQLGFDKSRRKRWEKALNSLQID